MGLFVGAWGVPFADFGCGGVCAEGRGCGKSAADDAAGNDQGERTPAPSQVLEEETEQAREEEFVLIYPVEGEIMRGYAAEELNFDPADGVYSTHDGVDFAGEAGDLVLCAADGTVEKVWVSEKYGNCVEIAHRNGYFSRYMSLGKIYVREGDRVEVGESVGTVGTCLWEDFVHLHFAVRRLTQSLDPEKLTSEE